MPALPHLEKRISYFLHFLLGPSIVFLFGGKKGFFFFLNSRQTLKGGGGGLIPSCWFKNLVQVTQRLALLPFLLQKK